MAHTGIRLGSPERYDPHRKQDLQEIVLKADIPAFTTSKDIAEHFRLEHGDKVDITVKDTNKCYVPLRKGAVLMVPKAVPLWHICVCHHYDLTNSDSKSGVMAPHP